MGDSKDAVADVRCEVKSLLLRQKKGQVEITEKDSKASNDDPYAKYALVSKQSFDEAHKHTGTTLEINSPYLLKVLKEVVTFYPGEPLDFSHKFVIEDPYMMLVHYQEALRTYREKSEDATIKMHIALLLDYLHDEAGPKGIETQEMLAAGQVTFPLLWMIFKPGDLVCEHSHGHSRLFQVRRHGYGESRNNGKYFDLSVSFVSYDGARVGYASDRLRIYDRKEFFGVFSAKITSLPVFPVKSLPAAERDSLQASLADRGQRYLKIQGSSVMQYHGLFLYLRRPPWDFYHEDANYDGTFLPETMSGRVVVDPKTFNEEARKRKESIADDDSDDETTGSDERNKASYTELAHDPDTKIDSRLCSSYVYGFSLEKKEWCKFFVDSLSPVKWRSDALESLILPAPQKRLLQGLVTGHKFPEKARDESGLKGKGLVVLLHGTPGTGKTFTAEMTAEHTHRALLNISTGELGSYQFRIEIELKRLLTYASTFQAIVLIDEADVFLEARTSGPAAQLEQNAMVAVFLRQLEYFQGIIFLTSNRVNVFDDAIKSRIHLALQYAPPDASVRRVLWRTHLARVPAGEMEMDLEAALDEVEGVGMNGREISNSIGTARTLAGSEGRRLGVEDLRTIMEVWKSFEENFGSLKIKEESK